MVSRRWARAALAVAALLPGWCAAQESRVEPIVTDRPDFTEAAVTVGKGRFQIESGVTGTRARGNAREFGTEVLLRYGTAPRSEVRLGLPSYNQLRSDGRNRSGSGDTYVGAKFQLGPTNNGLDISLIPAVFLPGGNRDFSSRGVDPEVKLCLAKGITERASLSGMLYASYPTEEDGRNATLQSTVSLGYALTQKVNSFYELVGTFPRRGGPESLLHAGVTFQPTPNVQWDVHFAAGLNTNTIVSFLAGGYSVRF